MILFLGLLEMKKEEVKYELTNSIDEKNKRQITDKIKQHTFLPQLQIKYKTFQKLIKWVK
jgi:hypothetical protein